MLNTNTIAELVERAGEGLISAVVLDDQAERDGVSRDVLIAKMREALQVMRQAAQDGMNPDLRSMSGMTGGQAALLAEAAAQNRTPGGPLLGEACATALAVAELNACMGRIVAAPTAGACGILPAALLCAQRERGLSDDQLVDALFTAAGVGSVIASRASVSGAEGGCQAECGSASAMAAAALAQLYGGTPDMAAQACALALINVMGLVCDPVGGLVEVPCVYRNVMGVSNALSAAAMAVSGIRLMLPADEVIDAMSRVGRMLPAALRETGEGGCASCPSAQCAR